MDNNFGFKKHVEGVQPDDTLDALNKKDEVSAVMQEAHSKYEGYLTRYDSVIGAYMQGADLPFTFKPGGWYVQLKGDIHINADPQFFIDKGYSEAESLYATFHEIEHFLDMKRDPEAYSDMFAIVDEYHTVHKAYPKVLHRFVNCLDDVLVNRRVDARWENGVNVKKNLYKMKLFPSSDLSKQPKHRQFGYAFLREIMLPHEQCMLSPEVREKVDEWLGLVKYFTRVDPISGAHELEPQERFAYILDTLEPVLQEFFQQDLGEKNNKEEEKEKGENGESGENGEKPESGDEDPFGDDPFADAIPDPEDLKNVLDKVKKINEAINKQISEDKKNVFEKVMGCTEKDYKMYKRDLVSVENKIDSLVEVFEKLLQEKFVQNQIKVSTKEGMIHPGKVGILYSEMQSGNLEPEAFWEYQYEQLKEMRVEELEFSVICDGSGSMQGNEKEVAQRKITILLLEAFERFREKITQMEEKFRMKELLKIATEVRIFSDTDHPVKNLSFESMALKDRVKIRSQLQKLPGGGNNEPATIAKLSAQFGEERVQKLRDGKLKKIIIFLTDGETDSAKVQEGIGGMYSKAGSEGRKNLVVAGVGFDGGLGAVNTYAPFGFYANTLEEIIPICEEIIKRVLQEL